MIGIYDNLLVDGANYHFSKVLSGPNKKITNGSKYLHTFSYL